jgi:hypothetical protein
MFCLLDLGILFQKKEKYSITYVPLHNPTKAICPYAMLTFYTYATCQYIERYQMLQSY